MKSAHNIVKVCRRCPMAKTAKAKAAQPWPYWMLRYVGTGEPQAFEELIWSVGGSPPYGGVSWEEAGAVYEMLESYQGAGRADPEKYSAVESFAGGDHANRLALEIFRIHDSVASSPNDLNETELARGGSLAEQ